MKHRERLIVLGMAFLAIGLVFVWHGLPRSQTIECDRIAVDRVNCKQQEIVLRLIPIKTILLKNLQAVRLGMGENAYDGIVYFIDFKGESSHLMFGNSLYLENIEADLQKMQQFLQDFKARSLKLERHEANYFFTIAGVLTSALGITLLRWKGIK